ncbi:hypothetical protein DP49_1071 [Burkholderia pseudomallei]|nr:hypothetical protein DP49_1071 [Burkholderia pseudomallei]KGW80982.1 hypothetical protein Y048_4211 [Burkholderia pseudomallei MSHR456]
MPGTRPVRVKRKWMQRCCLRCANRRGVNLISIAARAIGTRLVFEMDGKPPVGWTTPQTDRR